MLDRPDADLGAAKRLEPGSNIRRAEFLDLLVTEVRLDLNSEQAAVALQRLWGGAGGGHVRKPRVQKGGDRQS